MGGGGSTSIGASGAGFAVTHGGPSGAKLIRLDLDGRRTATDVSIGGSPAKLVWTGTRYAFAWSAPDGPVFLATIDPTATAPSAPVPVSSPSAVAAVNAVALVWNGDGYGVVWSDSRTGTSETHFAVVCPP